MSQYEVLSMDEKAMDILTGENLGFHLVLGLVVTGTFSGCYMCLESFATTVQGCRHNSLIETWPNTEGA